MDTLDLNIDELCDRSENPYLEKILNVWKQTNSPLWSHWRNLMKDATKLGEFELKSIGGACTYDVCSGTYDVFSGIRKGVPKKQM